MKTMGILPFKLTAFTVVSLLMAGCAQVTPAQASELPSQANLCLASAPGADAVAMIDSELALTDETRARGLMHRQHLAPDAGMLFYYPNTHYRSFWMFNTLIPLDIAYLSDEGEITQIITMEPCLHDNPGRCQSYPSDRRARAALELNAGAFEQLGVSVGDYVLEQSCRQAPWATGW